MKTLANELHLQESHDDVAALMEAAGLHIDMTCDELRAIWTPELAVEIARLDGRGPRVGAVALIDRALGTAVLRDADLYGACLDGACFDTAQLSRAMLNGARLERASFFGADLREADLRETRLDGASFRHADMRWSDLRGVRIERADMHRARLEGADLTGAIR